MRRRTSREMDLDMRSTESQSRLRLSKQQNAQGERARRCPTRSELKGRARWRWSSGKPCDHMFVHEIPVCMPVTASVAGERAACCHYCASLAAPPAHADVFCMAAL